MDQDTPTGSDKRPWRERLGIGTKEMPKISAEFKKAAPAADRQGPRPPQPVTKPAPMAPRAPSKPAPVPVPTTVSRPPAAQDALAERLKAQRAAAEKLAEQRVNAARLRAEAAKPQEAKPAARTEPALGPVPPSARGETARPKFSFADDDAARTGREAAPPGRQPGTGFPPPPLMPPRPSLGGTRAMPPVSSSYPSQGGFAPSRSAPPPPPTQRSPGYRPIDPATGYPPPPRGGSGYAVPPAAADYGHRAEYAEPRSAPQRPAGYAQQYRRPVEEENYPEERGDPRLARSMSRQRGAYYDEELDDVFEEDEPKARRRASASDYNRAYREVEDGFEEEDRQRSSGPWLLLLALLLAAVATGGIVWYYQTNIKAAGDGAATGGNVPVVGAPEQPAKTEPEQPAADPGAQGRKQIYDRIVGEQEVQGGEMVPTEEVPVQPDDQGGTDLLNQIPDPAGATDQDQPGDDPIPLPPPPGSNGDTQGFNAPDGGTAIAKTSASQANAAAVEANPGGNDGAASVTQAAPPSDDEPALNEPPAQQTAATQTEQGASGNDAAGPVVLVPTLRETTGSLSNDDAGAPLSLDPQPVDPIISQPPLAEPVPQPQPAKKKTLLSLFTGDEAPPAPQTDPSSSALTTQSSGAVTTQPAVQQQSIERSQNPARTQTRSQVQSQPVPQVESQPLPETQVASIPEPVPEAQPAPAPAPAPQAQAPAASGYFVQLASFRSESEAQAEFSRLKSKHGGLIGSYQSIISTATVAGSTRYRLALGPFGSRDQASGLCNSLVAAGERDCLVRRQ